MVSSERSSLSGADVSLRWLQRPHTQLVKPLFTPARAAFHTVASRLGVVDAERLLLPSTHVRLLQVKAVDRSANLCGCNQPFPDVRSAAVNNG